MTVQNIYQHLVTTNAPIHFQTKSTKGYRPNISQLSSGHQQIDYEKNNTDLEDHKEQNTLKTTEDASTFILHDDNDERHYIQYDATIKAFRHHSQNRPKIVCEACGLTGHPANKCYRRGFKFLPRDVQRRIAAFNTKYGDTPETDSSTTDLHKQILPAPDIKYPTATKNTSEISNNTTKHETQQATIHKLQHVLPPLTQPYDPDDTQHMTTKLCETQQNENIEFLVMQSMEENVPTIHMIQKVINPRTTTTNTTDITPINPLSTHILNPNGEVNLPELHTLQDQLIHPTPLKHFRTYRHQYFHIDTGANVHATTDKRDFLVFYPQRKSINIAAGQTTESEGFGVVMVQLKPDKPPLPFAPVYYCPHATTGTLSPQCLHLYNKCKHPTHRLFEHLSMKYPHHDDESDVRVRIRHHQS